MEMQTETSKTPPIARSMSAESIAEYKDAMQSVYGPFEETCKTVEQAKRWEVPELMNGAGDRGRYLWTDAFGVLNFLTLYVVIGSSRYLHLAARLVHAVHSVLGRQRHPPYSRLPNATSAHPLRGGLRIGKVAEYGPDGDGQYHHYLTLWMFALNRMTVASGDSWWNHQAADLGKAIHKRFVVNRRGKRPNIVWKMDINLERVLVGGEGNLDPVDGLVVFDQVLNEGMQRRPYRSQTGGLSATEEVEKKDEFEEPWGNGEDEELKGMVEEYRRMVEAKYENGGFNSEDALDLGMTLWSVHWRQEEEWARGLKERAFVSIRTLDEDGFFTLPHGHRLAFREFGMCLGIRCYTANKRPTSARNAEEWEIFVKKILAAWKAPNTSRDQTQMVPKGKTLTAITGVMYCAAIYPGTFTKGFIEEAMQEEE